MTTNAIRKLWLDFFESKKHEIIDSKSLIPYNDPSLLWINSGVATLKDFFSGFKLPNNPRITNSQKCIRTNDIENVGVTARHQTLFEMLGNFSIGDYFKDEAIEYGFEFLFDVLKFSKEKIYFTYFDEDEYTREKWLSLGIEDSHIIKGNRDTNFWDVGLGPCGPDTEIFYDRGEKYDPERIGIKLLKDDLENDRYIEIWNIVFSEFNNDGEGNYNELKQKNIDTGAGLERLASVLQEVPTNFDTDVFQIIINKICEITNTNYDVNNYFTNEPIQKEVNRNLKVIADHMRAVTLAIQDGAIPTNTSRGYIIRRLIRRSYRSGIKLGMPNEPFLYNIVSSIKKAMSVYEVDLTHVETIIKKEELAFSKTIKQGEEILKKWINEKKDDSEFDFSLAFKLFETFGFPIELTQEILSENKIKLDISKFDEHLERHAEVSKGEFAAGMQAQINVIQDVEEKISQFSGYEKTNETSKVIFNKEENGKNYILTESTPFYATSGGQVADKGTINGVEVLDVFKDKFGNHWMVTIDSVDDELVELIVDKHVRLNSSRNHSAAHLLGYALEKVFGHSKQLGSENTEHKLRFDFPNETKPTMEELNSLEELINTLINGKSNRHYIITNYKDAIDMGAIALEGEEYGEVIRVVKFDGISMEFCGGVHVENTSVIEKFKIIKLSSKGTGIFRIEALTSFETIDKFETAQLTKKKNILDALIEKNISINSNYVFLDVPTIDNVDLLIGKAKSDNKSLKKKSKNNVVVDISNVESTTLFGLDALVNLHDDPKTLKIKSVTLREKHPDKLIYLKAETDKVIMHVVASKQFDSKDVFDKNIANVKGNGGSDFVMGVERK